VIDTYKTIIVEDEKRIREGLKILVDWNALGFVIAGECENGVDAVKMLMGGGCDLLVCDIRLPGMTGLDVLKELRESGAGCKAIVISGYADFDYAKTAIDYGVKKYLVKPVNEMELAETLAVIRAELDGERNAETPVLSGLEAAVMRYIEKNYMHDISIRKVSEELGYNSCYIGRAFLRKAGMPMRDYISMVRVKMASKLLLQGDMKTQDIAFEVGFRDLNKFYREFKRFRNTTPKKYLAGLEDK
jgi:two-component system response regulator YesN